MKKGMKMFTGAVLGFAVLVGSLSGSLVADASANQVKATKNAVKSVEVQKDRFAIPTVVLGEKVESGKLNSIFEKDQSGIEFVKYKTFTDYKKVRDFYFESDIPMAKDYWKQDRDIMPVLEKEYLGDIYKAKVYFGYIAEKDTLGIQFVKYPTLGAYTEARYVYFEMDLPMAKEYKELLGKDIMPILQGEYDRDVKLAKEYFEAKKYGAVN